MAKKKINIKSVSTDVESGDVNISYKNVRIAGLNESTTAVLETKDTICEDDIEVEYTKPTIPTNLYYTKTIPLTTSITAGIGTMVVGTACVNENGELHILPVAAPAVNALSFAYTDTEQTLDIILAPILAEGHSFTITADNTTLPLIEVVNTGTYTLYAATIPLNTTALTITAS